MTDCANPMLDTLMRRLSYHKMAGFTWIAYKFLRAGAFGEDIKNIEAFDNTLLEEARRNQKNFIPTISDNCIVDEIKVDKKYVIKSKEYLVNKLKIYEDVIDEKWQDLNNNRLYREWIKIKCIKDTRRVVLYLFGGGFCIGSPRVYHSLTCKIAETAECPVFSSSAGSRLAVATALFLHDADLLLPSGLVLWSAYIDLTSSMPSCWDPEMDKTDYLLAALSIPSPMLAESLENLPPILCMISDKIIEFSIKRSCDFIKNHTLNEYISDDANIKSLQGIYKTITAIAISPNCEIRELDENI
ncbi:alpha/beta-hydrolase [Gigaspora margarita]|uniref:Alpha/beta-hydrolase n=1 Tax=Gigaspora margarita TaxID=4874 RepID=A0A8H4AT05_GIGMA|nr:alpha/beta-hydrolase [Gigaspora margarita]